MSEDKAILYTPPIKSFKDTGYVQHAFNDGASIRAKVVKGDSAIDPVMIELELIGGDEQVFNVALGRFEALCLVDTIVKNLLNQEELTQIEIDKMNKGGSNENQPN